MSKKISMQEAADIYGVSRATIRRWVEAGLITGYRVGPRVIRLDADELDEQLRGAPVGGGDAT
jgi:excisionase family DNA binding protein